MDINHFPNHVFVTEKLPSFLTEKLNTQSEKILSNTESYTDVTDDFVGHLNHEYELDIEENKELCDYLLRLASEYTELTNIATSVQNENTSSSDLKIKELWINYFYKNEFSTLHNHSGTLAFVIWLNVPYTVEDEAAFYKNKRRVRSGCLEFAYTNVLGRIERLTIDVNKDMEGVVCMFPATLNHVVYPFRSSDEPRISIAGNIGI